MRKPPSEKNSVVKETIYTTLVSTVNNRRMNRLKKSRSAGQKKSSVRQQIVNAARTHFFSHGFRRVTMDDLAEELGISKKTLYAHFPGKFDLLEAVLADKLTSVEATLKEVTRAHPDDFPATLRNLLAGTQRELDEIKPPFVRDMRQKAPDVFKLVERRRRALIQRYMGRFFVDGQRVGMVRKDIPAKLIVEILLAMVQSIMNPPKMEELGMMPKEGYTGILKIVLEGALTPKGRKS
jgi:AcrR family transcriptional regulator